MTDHPNRYGFERFDCAPALRLDAHEKLAQIQHDAQQRRLDQIAQQMERLEKRLWLSLYGVVGVILTQAIQKSFQFRPSDKDANMSENLELKFSPIHSDAASDGALHISGYASFFDELDSGGDRVMRGAFTASILDAAVSKRGIKMLWQHDATQPIGIWDEIVEDGRGLRVKGRLLAGVNRAQEAKHLIEAGAIDGLSIGYSVKKASFDQAGNRCLEVIDLYEISLVTFPMLATARLGAKSQTYDELAMVLGLEKAKLQISEIMK